MGEIIASGFCFLLTLVSLTQGTVVEGTIQQLLEGHHMNYIECINVDYKSTRKESFYGRYRTYRTSMTYYDGFCMDRRPFCHFIYENVSLIRSSA